MTNSLKMNATDDALNIDFQDLLSQMRTLKNVAKHNDAKLHNILRRSSQQQQRFQEVANTSGTKLFKISSINKPPACVCERQNEKELVKTVPSDETVLERRLHAMSMKAKVLRNKMITQQCQICKLKKQQQRQHAHVQENEKITSDYVWRLISQSRMEIVRSEISLRKLRQSRKDQVVDSAL